MSYRSHNHSVDCSEEMSTRAYNCAIGLILLLGLGINALMVRYLTERIMQIPLPGLLIGYLVVSIIGILMSLISKNPFVSFIGYLMVVVPCGALLAVSIEDISIDVVIHATNTTSLLTIVILVFSTAWPNFFSSLGRVLFICLTVVIIIELVAYLFFTSTMPTFWYHLAVALLCLYIGYDWTKAQEKRHTLDNAVDACIGLYLDIINIFIRLVASSSSNKSSSRK